MATNTVLFPGNLSKVETIAQLRRLTGDSLVAENVVMTLGAFAFTDGMGAFYTYDPGSAADDDGAYVIKPTSVSGAGRWVAFVNGLITFPDTGDGEVFNYNPAYLAKWRKARGNVRAGLLRAKVACVGDSTTVGDYSGGTQGYRTMAWPGAMALALSGAGLNAKYNNWFGNSGFGFGGSYPAYDPRISPGTWDASVSTLSGTFAHTATPSTSPFRLTLPSTFAGQSNYADTVDVYYATSFGTASFSFNGTPGTAINSAGALSMAKATRTGTRAAGAYFELARSAGSDFYLWGMDAYDSTIPDVGVLLLAANGVSTANVAEASGPLSPLNVLGFVAPDLTIINLGINDWVQGTSIAAFRAAYQAIITKAKLTGDVLIVVPVPSSADYASVALQSEYIAVMYDLAVLNNCVLIDMTRRFVSWAQASADSFVDDGLHYSRPAYDDEGQAIADLLLR